MRLSLSGVSRARRAAGGTLVGGLESFGELASRRPLVATAVVLSGGIIFGHGSGDVWVWVVGSFFTVGLGVRSCLRRPGSQSAGDRRGRADVRGPDGPGVLSDTVETVTHV